MDLQTLARTARENLSRGLGALQSPGLPPQIGHAAEPIAAAMNSLHQVERTGGVGTAESAHAALAYVRQALSELQTAGFAHAAVDQAMEAIASSLSLVHQLSVQVGNASMVPSPPTQQSSAFRTAPEPQPQVAVVGHAPQQQPPWPAPAPVSPTAATQVAHGWAQATQPAANHHAPTQAAPVYQPPPQAAPAYPPTAQAIPAYQAPPQAAVPHAPQHVPAPVAGAAAPHGAGSNAIRVEAELGAHSTTNFYKGLSGNDVIDSGGIFIATYQIPAVGQQLVIRVSMPGGYEFEALGVVRWSRDAPSSGADSSPGFGAQFTSITPEARQLVYRYVRNREPLFHDDF
jgi:hypothetical protein